MPTPSDTAKIARHNASRSELRLIETIAFAQAQHGDYRNTARAYVRADLRAYRIARAAYRAAWRVFVAEFWAGRMEVV